MTDKLAKDGAPRRTTRTSPVGSSAQRANAVVRAVPPPPVVRQVEIEVERIIPGGLGLAHAAGKTLFVPLAAPGDRLLVNIERDRGRTAYASIVEILEPGIDRIPLAWPLLSRCGADFQHLRYDAQLVAKSSIIADCLRRIGGIMLDVPIAVQPSPVVWGYRARAEWRHDPAQPAFGYLETGTHHVVDIPTDPFVVPRLAEQFAHLRERFELGALPHWATELRAVAGEDGVSVGPPLDMPQPLPVHTVVSGERLTYDADCFFQVNPFVLEELVAEALRFAAPSRPTESADTSLAIDLYCGVGLFTLHLARRSDRVVGIEAHERAAAFATANIAAAGLRNARIEISTVERWLAGAYRSHGRVPFVLLDPPRTGLPLSALRALLRLRASRLTYVSCDPATLARDLKTLRAAGYEIDALAAFDMFPQTHHVEIVAHLRRRNGGR